MRESISLHSSHIHWPSGMPGPPLLFPVRMASNWFMAIGSFESSKQTPFPVLVSGSGWHTSPGSHDGEPTLHWALWMGRLNIAFWKSLLTQCAGCKWWTERNFLTDTFWIAQIAGTAFNVSGACVSGSYKFIKTKEYGIIANAHPFLSNPDNQCLGIWMVHTEHRYQQCKSADYTPICEQVVRLGWDWFDNESRVWILMIMS